MAQRTPRRQRRPRSTPAGARKRQYSFPELAAAWVAVGGNPKYAQLAAAVAMAESGGRTGAAVHSANPGGGINRGPWQIWSGHRDSSDDLLGSARAAKRISKNGTDWSAWEAYTNGSYKKFMVGDAPDKSFLEKLSTGPLGDAAAAVAKPLEPLVAVGELAMGLTELILTPEGWRRILKVTIGGIILLWALNQLGKSTMGANPARSIRRGVVKATPVGKAAGAAVASKLPGKAA